MCNWNGTLQMKLVLFLYFLLVLICAVCLFSFFFFDSVVLFSFIWKLLTVMCAESNSNLESVLKTCSLLWPGDKRELIFYSPPLVSYSPTGFSSQNKNKMCGGKKLFFPTKKKRFKVQYLLNIFIKQMGFFFIWILLDVSFYFESCSTFNKSKWKLRELTLKNLQGQIWLLILIFIYLSFCVWLLLIAATQIKISK